MTQAQILALLNAAGALPDSSRRYLLEMPKGGSAPI